MTPRPRSLRRRPSPGVGIGAPQLAELASLLTQETGRPYRFLHMGEAYAQLRGELKAVAKQRRKATLNSPTRT